ncbi:hypothetical protein JIW86_22770 [Streptomyces sp. NBC_00162]|nr:hypothetical protein JIW86_22770 [Streptomyces sp. NBC_00162]
MHRQEARLCPLPGGRAVRVAPRREAGARGAAAARADVRRDRPSGPGPAARRAPGGGGTGSAGRARHGLGGAGAARPGARRAGLRRAGGTAGGKPVPAPADLTGTGSKLSR